MDKTTQGLVDTYIKNQYIDLFYIDRDNDVERLVIEAIHDSKNYEEFQQLMDIKIYDIEAEALDYYVNHFYDSYDVEPTDELNEYLSEQICENNQSAYDWKKLLSHNNYNYEIVASYSEAIISDMIVDDIFEHGKGKGFADREYLDEIIQSVFAKYENIDQYSEHIEVVSSEKLIGIIENWKWKTPTLGKINLSELSIQPTRDSEGVKCLPE